MASTVARLAGCALALTIAVSDAGCKSDKGCDTSAIDPWAGSVPTALNLAQPEYNVAPDARAMDTSAPRTLRNNQPVEYWDLSLEEAIKLGLNSSRVLRDAGGRLLANPTVTQTTYDPAMRETDARQGPIAAETAYDPTYKAGIDWINSDRFYNNIFQGGGTHQLDSDRVFGFNSISKQTTSGTQMSLSNITDYRNNNAPGNEFSSLWSTSFVGTVTQPLLQGAGTTFNQIAGSGGMPGVNNGVWIGRINTDISLTDFETALRNYLLDTERAYWELFYAYRDLDSKIAARNTAVDLWRNVSQKAKAGAFGGDQETEARAREQYYLFQAQVENSLSGSSATGGSAPASVGIGTNGVYTAERRLRLLLGLPATERRLIRPTNAVPPVEIVYDWDQILPEALMRRVELRKQKFMIKRRELELVAARNYLLPQLNAIGTYSFTGYGQGLVAAPSSDPFSSAYQNLTSSEHSHFANLGLVYSQPIGNRIGHTDVRNAELTLARERALLAEQELLVAQELSSAVAEADRAYALTRTTFNRRAAAEEQFNAITRKYLAGAASLDPVLDAQRRLADAGSAFFRSVSDYNRALADVHYARGTLLDYNGVYLTEGPSPLQAYQDATRMSRRVRPANFNYSYSGPILSTQPVMQGTLPPPGSTPLLEPLPNVPPAVPVDTPNNQAPPEPLPSPPAGTATSPAKPADNRPSTVG